MPMRLDLYLVEKGLAGSRTDAKRVILENGVSVKGKTVNKPAFDISPDETEVSVMENAKKYASRGGFKLECAMSAFDFTVADKLALDVGASSGGFTDCLLQNGAAHVISVDSGFGQLAEFLRCDQRVTVIEKYNARYMKSEDFEYAPNLAVMDVSFISATYIIPALYNVLADGADFICLIKPQFEVGRSALGKNGIVKDEKQRQYAVQKVTEFAKAQGFSVYGVITSSIEGGDGNIEYLAHFKKEGEK
jgi:23S rRNA (cytidine1920-2'-O)/16S rRNA (cytidine1409-2'-O)-methyltransferase